MEDKQKVIDKIVKLMKKAESAKELGSISEAEAFAEKAQKMLADYNLSRKDLTQKEAEAEVIHDQMPAKVPGIGGKSSYNVMSVIAYYNWCRVYTMGKTSDNKMIIVGSPENIEVCKYIHSVVMNVLMYVGKVEYKGYKDNFVPFSGSNQAKPVGFDTYMRTFFLGAAKGLREKLEAERVRMMESNPNSGAIVLVNEGAIELYVNQKWGGAGYGRKTRYGEAGGAYGKGRSAGSSVQIAKGIQQSKPIQRKMLN